MKTALTLLGNKNIQYLVLEQPIHDTVLRSLPFLSGKVEALNHPISPNEAESQTNDLGEPIRFGFLGLADKPKGFPLFVQVADHVTAKYGQRVEFHAIGHLPKGGESVNGIGALATKPGSTLMSRADFIRRVVPLHFVILSHEATPYTLAASGVMLDAIAWGKPVIARRIPIFETMFERHGDIGYLFSDDGELGVIVERILLEADKARYHRQVMNLGSAKKARTPENLAASYRDICRKSR
jgi:hypothetical protein